MFKTKNDNKTKKKNPVQMDPAYATLTPGLRADIDQDVKGIARQEAVNGGLKWGLAAFVLVLVMMAFVM
jgi:hypothetical protein